MDLGSKSGLALRSTVTGDALRLSLERVAVVPPGLGEVLVRMDAAPIHPADVMVLFAGAELGAARTDSPEALVAPLPEHARSGAAGRMDRPLKVGLEGAGVVLAAGQDAEALIGKSVAVLVPGLGAYAQYCTVPAASCIELPAGLGPRAGAAAFTNPLTALAMVETLHQTGERAMVHTAAASSLGQMLVRICAEDGIGLINIVRRPEQVDLLRALGADHVCDSSASDFRAQLARALAETGARVAFDAIGGGDMASTLLEAMEEAAVGQMADFNAYGSPDMKRVYLYGRLDSGVTVIPRGPYGLLWSLEGWSMPPILERAGEGRTADLRRRIAEGLSTTFTTAFGSEITLPQMLDPAVVQRFARHETAGKFLVTMPANEDR
ncbi:zinc-binding dehydrogenase [Novosphingobium sp. M1R2S20]|uniref:Zinc-binding dehydrogenase n=1 Tax=Novosphingobium rhizovicinum TaxID=3228928 RepID=A0ABV3REM9_9SPHN